MPPVKKSKKQAKTATAPPAENAPAGSEEQLAISGQLQKKMLKTQANIDRQRGVVFIRHLPHGFFEEQLKNYFQQFGTVTNLRLARSTRTGSSKGFAFIEFEYPQVAEVAAKTMDNYLMFSKLVKAHYIPPEKQVYNYFKSSVKRVNNKIGKPIYFSGKKSRIQRKFFEHNNWSDEAYQKRIASNIRKLEKLKEKYAHLGIDFDSFTVKPNITEVKEKSETAKDSSEDKQKSKPGSSVLVKKRKQSEKSEAAKDSEPGSTILNKKRKQSEDKAEKSVKKSEKSKVKKIIELKDLLENTLNEEASSEDEEFVPTAADEDLSTSDEEDYSLEIDDDDEEEVKPPVVKKEAKPKKIDRGAELLKRKVNAGRIQKSKKTIKEKPKKQFASIKDSLKVEAAKDIKLLGQVKQMKKKDFNKSNKKKRV